VDANDPMLKAGYVAMAAIAGAVTALSFMKWKEMTYPEVFLTLFVGFSFAIFVTPWVAYSVFGMDNVEEVGAVAGLTYITASGSNSLLPVLIKKVRRLLGERNGEGTPQ
jgi:hypothetical protein